MGWCVGIIPLFKIEKEQDYVWLHGCCCGSSTWLCRK